MLLTPQHQQSRNHRAVPRTDCLIKRFIFFQPKFTKASYRVLYKKNHGNVHFTQTPEGKEKGGEREEF